MRRTTRLPRLGIQLASTAAALATCWSLAAFEQQPGLPSLPPVTAAGVQANLPGKSASIATSLPTTGAGTVATPVAATTVTATPPVVPPVDPFLAQLDTAIEVSSRRFLSANTHSPWQIFHGLLALKQSFQLNLNGQKVNAIEWIATSEPKFDNQPLLMKTAHGGKFHPFTRPYAFEGHPAQFLALLSQSDLPTTFAFKVGREQITLGNIINNTMKEVNNREEVTWVLWGLQHYLKPDAHWVNQHNEPWSIERLVQIETAASVVGAPCGGNHRLFALTRTRDKHLKNGGTLTGIWAQADYKIRQHIEVARSMQNSDGTFSAKFYETSGFTTDLNSRFNTTGHTMEFLSIALPNERLQEQWVRNAVSVLCNDLIGNRQRVIDCGPLYHTLNSLIIYRERIRPTPVTVPMPQVADSAEPASKPITPPSKPIAIAAPPVAANAAIASNPIDTKTVTSEKTTPDENSKPTPAVVPMPPMPQTKPEPSEDALNELKLGSEFRDKLNALSARRSTPGAVLPDPKSRPLDAIGQPMLQDHEEPVSALVPENRP